MKDFRLSFDTSNVDSRTHEKKECWRVYYDNLCELRIVWDLKNFIFDGHIQNKCITLRQLTQTNAHTCPTNDRTEHNAENMTNVFYIYFISFEMVSFVAVKSNSFHLLQLAAVFFFFTFFKLNSKTTAKQRYIYTYLKMKSFVYHFRKTYHRKPFGTPFLHICRRRFSSHNSQLCSFQRQQQDTSTSTYE